MDADAVILSKFVRPQYELGSDFIRDLGISEGDRVVDMGCGTGDVTKFVSDMVGLYGIVVGVDPDEARIDFAREKFKDVQNMQFVVGDSNTGFPHHTQEYYDYHVSTNAYHWLTGDEKLIYLRAAEQCLKSAGKLAILCSESGLNDGGELFPKYLTLEQHTQLFREVDLFTDVVIERRLHNTTFDSFDEFQCWFEAAAHCALNEMRSEFFKEVLPKYFKEENDGRFTMQFPGFVITARK